MAMITSVCTDASLTDAVVEITRNILHQIKLHIKLKVEEYLKFPSTLTNSNLLLRIFQI